MKTPEIIIKSGKILTLKKNTAREAQLDSGSTALNQASSASTKSSKERKIQKDIPAKVHNFNDIYNELHSKFPAIIDLNNPVLLAVGIRQAMTKATGISGVVLKKWMAWYCRTSKYYHLHTVGAMRFNLDGTEAGIVTEKHQEKRDKLLAYLAQVKKTKNYK